MRSRSRVWIGLVLLVALVGGVAVYLLSWRGLPANRGGRRGRSEPVCAVRDCVTDAFDDGCSDDGRCLKCVNMCPP